jgi:hypothetical protein
MVMSEGLGVILAAGLIQLGFGGFYVLLTHRYKEAVRGDVERMLNEQRHELNELVVTQQHHHEQQMEQVRLERERLTQDFSLFVAKRNDAYADIYSKFAEAIGRLLGAADPLKFGSNRKRLTRNEVADLMNNELNFISAQKGSILTLWDTDRNAAVELLEKEEAGLDRGKAQVSFTEAMNALVKQKIYVSQEVELAVLDLTTKYGPAMAHLLHPDENASGKAHELAQAADLSLSRLRFAMQEEMRRGFASLPGRPAK